MNLRVSVTKSENAIQGESLESRVGCCGDFDVSTGPITVAMSGVAAPIVSAGVLGAMRVVKIRNTGLIAVYAGNTSAVSTKSPDVLYPGDEIEETGVVAGFWGITDPAGAGEVTYEVLTR